MDGMSDLLFGRLDGGFSVVVVVARLLATAMVCAALVLLARRNQVGWWLLVGSVLPSGTTALIGLLNSAGGSLGAVAVSMLSMTIWLLLTLGVGVYGFLSFQKFPPVTSSVRDITLRRFTGPDLVLPLLVALVYAIGSILATATIFRGFTGDSPPVTLILTLGATGFMLGLLPAGFAGLAQRSRWAWFLIAVASIVDILGATLAANGSAIIFLLLAQTALALYGWGKWRGMPEEPAGKIANQLV